MPSSRRRSALARRSASVEPAGLVGHGTLADRHPLAAHVVGQGGGVLEHLPHRRPVMGVVLEGDPPARRDLGEHAADHAEAVLAAIAGDGDPRLAPDLGRALEDGRVGDVGEVGEDEVDLLVEILVRKALLDRDLEVDAEPLGVLAGDFGRLGREVGGGHLQVRALVEQGEGDGAGSGADLVHAGALGQLGGDLDQQAGLPARDQHPRVDGDVDPLEGLVAEDVGERLVLGAAR